MGQVRIQVTLQDVADRAGVSLTTASRVVNEGSRRVGPRLAERVNRAVAELGYTANLQARAVATGQSTMVGVVVHDIADPYFSSIAAGLIEVAEARGLLVCMSSTAAAEAAEREYVALMRAQRARAVILIGSRTGDVAGRDALRAEISAFTHEGGRAVAVGQDLLGVDTVLPENAAGAEALARAMVALGHRRFAVLAGPRGLLTARDRLDGFRAGLAAWGVPPGAARVVHGPFTRDGGYEAMSALLSATAEPAPGLRVRGHRRDGHGRAGPAPGRRPGRARRHRAGRVRRHRHPARRLPAADHGPAAAQADGGDGGRPDPGRPGPPPGRPRTRTGSAHPSRAGSSPSPARSSCAKAPSRTRPLRPPLTRIFPHPAPPSDEPVDRAPRSESCTLISSNPSPTNLEPRLPRAVPHRANFVLEAARLRRCLARPRPHQVRCRTNLESACQAVTSC